MDDDTPTIDVAFPIEAGARIPEDHGFPLFSALSRVIPEIHEHASWGVHLIQGRRHEDASIDASSVKLRIPLTDLPKVCPLQDTTIEVLGTPLRLRRLQASTLVSAPTLATKIVTIRGGEERAAFEAALWRKIIAAGLGTNIWVEVGRSRVLTIHGKRIVGYAVRLSGLDPQASVLIQKIGLGGRRHMGAGIFVPPPAVSPP